MEWNVEVNRNGIQWASTRLIWTIGLICQDTVMSIVYSSRSWTHSSTHTFHYKYITKLPSLTIIVIELHSPTCSLYGCLMWTRHIKHQQHTAGESDIWYRSRVVSTQPRLRWNTFFVVSQFEQTQALDTHMSTCWALYTTQHITSA